MNTSELKSNLHKIIDTIESEQLLQSLFDLLKEKKTPNSNKALDLLTEEQKAELFLSFEESEIEENLINKEKFQNIDE
ncbi:hypothetical protein M3O96_05030 [Aquiflexum sp. TKW24L]|uniref:hypothetical protein n=1 Tax=Aquiflexum sp. TKW24L TaxID=2942212 RepID=UPI0020BECA12|nr:hypothetical protein [Aquiflexum sp. TKW24L]MCL6258440.1 hypothetical protein [Aquiflexum sp. TKW24L]